MNTELRKRLEEAADKIVGCDTCTTKGWMKDCRLKCPPRAFAIEGAKYGYKEAIAQAKEWIRRRNRHACKEWIDKECSDFESDMNKLWEEQK